MWLKNIKVKLKIKKIWKKRKKRKKLKIQNQNAKNDQFFRFRYSCTWICVTLFPNRLRKL